MSLNFNRSKVMTHMHAKDRGQRSLGSEDRVETDVLTEGERRTEPIALPSSLTRSVIGFLNVSYNLQLVSLSAVLDFQSSNF